MKNGHRLAVVAALAGSLTGCGGAGTEGRGAGPRTFATPEGAVHALSASVKRGNVDEVVKIFGPDGQALVDSSDPVTARRNREVFNVAMAEGWRLEYQDATRATLVVGNEEWPFPVPLILVGDTWRFDVAAGREEIIARRIGRNELAAMRICHAYVTAQRVYAKHGHDGRQPGVYARAFRSDPSRQNGLYWAEEPGERRSPLGDLLAAAADEAAARPAGGKPWPFHGYYFRILTGQGAGAPGGARNYVVNGTMTGGFALVAWPAEYDVTGIMTFVVNQDGVVLEKDLGAGTGTVARAMSLYNPDASWTKVD